MIINTRKLGMGLIALAVVLFISLGFIKVNVDKSSEVLCELTAEADLLMENCPAHNNNNSWYFISAFGITFLILGGGIFLTLQKATVKSKKSRFKEINIEELDSKEKESCKILKENDGSIYQSDLVKKTELSKVKITRLLDHLEQIDIIERKRRGMTNIVVLK